MLFLAVAVAAGILSPDRSTVWNPGIPGGIPIIISPVIDVVEVLGAPDDSSADAASAIQTALDSLKTTGGVVYLPPGKYRLDKALSFNGDSTVLRGAGADRTKLYLGHTGDALFIGVYGRGEWQDIVEADKGSTVVTVTDGTKFTPGNFAEIQQKNNNKLMITDPEWDVDWAENSVGQLFEVESVNGNEVTFKTPLHYRVNVDLSPQIRPQKLRHHVGIEQCYLEKTIDNGNTILVKNAAYCWVRFIESAVTRTAHIATNTALGCHFSENYFHHSFCYGGGGSGYGTSIGFHSTDCLVENTIFIHLRHAMIIQCGAVGNVFAYNFSTDPVQGESDTLPLNETWDPPDISFHGHYAQFNLSEGNIVTEIGIADYWGPMGPGNTFFRNLVNGNDGIVLSDHSHYQNVIGNRAAQWKSDGTSEYSQLHGNRWGNATVQWDSTITDTVLPPSLFLSEKPWYWATTLPWPPEVNTPSIPATIPAEQRWKSGTIFETGTSSRDRKRFTLKNGHPPPCAVQTTSNGLFITLAQEGILSILDLHGREVWTFTYNQNGICHHTIRLSTGCYLLKFKRKNGANSFHSKSFLLLRGQPVSVKTELSMELLRHGSGHSTTPKGR